MPTQDIKITLTKNILSLITQKVAKAAGEAIAKEIDKIIWDRTAKGIDIEGKSWRRYKALNYYKVKRHYGRSVNKSGYPTDGSWLILTGDLKKDTKTKYLGADIGLRKITLKFQSSVKARSEKKAEGLLSTTGYDRNRKSYSKSAYKFLGLSQQGSEVMAERSRITKVLKRFMDAKNVQTKVSQ